MLHRAAEAPLQHRRASEKGADHRGGAASTMCRYMFCCVLASFCQTEEER